MWVYILLGSLAVLVIFFLCIPLDMVWGVEFRGKPRLRLNLRWLFGLVRKDINNGKVRKATRKREARIGIKDWNQLRPFISLLWKERRMFRLKEVRGDFKIGLGNPAATGFLCGFIYPAASLINTFSSCQIRVQPSFEEETLQGELHGVIRLQPVRVRPLTGFRFSLAAIRAIRLAIKTDGEENANLR